MKKYALLWRTFQEREFSYMDVSELFKGENINVIRTMISQLRRNGWLTVALDQKDSRKRVYKLRPLQEILENMGVTNLWEEAIGLS